MNRLFALFGTLLLTVSCMNTSGFPLSIYAEDLQKCGDNITWEFDDDTNTLTLTGTGKMYDYSDTFSLPWLKHVTHTEHLVIGDGITAIGRFAFSYLGKFTKVSIPDSVTEIGDFAFHGLSELSDIEFSVNLQSIGDYAFDSNNLTKVQIPEGTKTIGEMCFANNDNLLEITVPDSVTYIGAQGLTTNPEWYQKQREKGDFLILGDGVLYQYFGSEMEVTVPEGVKTIAGKAFYVPMTDPTSDNRVMMPVPNTKLKAVRFSDTVKAIGANAFYGLEALDSVILPPHLQTIGENAFYNCSSLAEISIPETVQDVGYNAFFGTKWLKQQSGYVMFNSSLHRYIGYDKILEIPENVRKIYADTVISNNVVEIHIPDTVQEIEKGALRCPNAVVVGTTGSIAEHYAAENDLPFRDEKTIHPAGKDMTLDLEKDVWSFGNSDKAFGTSYYISENDLQALNTQNLNTENIEKAWEGSCVGLAITAILAKNGIIRPEQLQENAKTVSDLQPTEKVQSLINYYQCTQGKTDTPGNKENDAQQFYRMVNLAKNVKNGESPFLVVFALDSGSHGVIGYGQEDGAWEFGGKTYDARILIWDSNFPDGLHDDSCIYYDSRTFNYCIPYYMIHVADDAADNTNGIYKVCNDLNILNAYPHPLTKTLLGDINCDGQLTITDAILLARVCAEDNTIQSFDPQDINGDGYITVTDVAEILKMLARI